MRKCILITNADFDSSAGNITLVLRRAESLYKIKNIFTEIIVFNGLNPKNDGMKDYYYNITVHRSINSIKQMMFSVNPEFIILYGAKVRMMTYFIHTWRNKYGNKYKVYLDVQGAIEESIEYAESLVRKIKYPLYYITFRLALSNADGVFVVSEELKDNCKKKLFFKRNLDYKKIRCGINNLPSTEIILTKRNNMRHRLNISNDAVVFVYSGYRLPWQKIESIISQFILMDSSIDNAFFMFLCNTDEEFETELRNSFPKGNYYVGLFSQAEYFEALYACDVGYILRDYNETNRVAFPNKFSDYLSAGLIVALNNALPEPMRVLLSNGMEYINVDDIDIEKCVRIIDCRNNNYTTYIQKSLDVCRRELLYDVQIANEFSDY